MKQPNHQRSSVTPADFRRALGRFASGVTIITALTPKGRPEGMTVSAFCSLSLTPPLVLACIAKNTRSHDIFESASHFVVNILAENQRHLSVAFSRKSNNRFRELSWATWESGAPVLDGCVANLECSRTVCHDGGDHVILIGRVEKLAISERRQPMIYSSGTYRRMGGKIS